MYCKNCGHKLNNHAKYCRYCGKKTEEEPHPKKKKTALIICLIAAAAAASGLFAAACIKQKNLSDMSREQEAEEAYLDKGFLDLDTSSMGIQEITDAASAVSVLQENEKQFGFSNAFHNLSTLSVNTYDGTTYYRLQENYQNLPVLGRVVIAWTDESGHLIRLTGNPTDIKEGDYTAGISEEDALKSLKKYCILQKTAAFNTEISPYKNESDVEIYTFSQDGTQQPVYKEMVTLGNAGPFEAVVNANTAEVISLTDTMKEIDAGSTVSIKAQGQNAVESLDVYKDDQDSYHLMDRNRNVYLRRAAAKNTGSEELSSIPEVTWKVGQEPTEYRNEISAMSKTEKIRDYFSQNLNFPFEDTKTNVFAITNVLLYQGQDLKTNARGGPGGNGKDVFIYLGKDLNYDETDIIAHEFSHGTIGLLGGFPAGGDSGAIGEAIGDILGEFAEYRIDGQCDWKNVCRNYADPLGNKGTDGPGPAKMHDKKWMISDRKYEHWLDIDNYPIMINDVAHNNSTIISHAAYLMSQGMPENKDSALTIEQLENVWYRTVLGMTNCYNTYGNLRTTAIASAIHLTSAGKLSRPQLACVKWAFDEVGIAERESDSSSGTVSDAGSSENDEPDKAVYVDPTEDDWKKLEEEMSLMIYLGQYDSATADLHDSDFCSVLTSNAFKEFYESKPELEKLYGKVVIGDSENIVPKELMDYFLKNIMNIQPDHSVNSEYLSFRDGNYHYVQCGFGDEPTMTITGKKQTDNSRYDVEFKNSWYDDAGPDCSAEVCLKNIAGHRYWSYYKISNLKDTQSSADSKNNESSPTDGTERLLSVMDRDKTGVIGYQVYHYDSAGNLIRKDCDTTDKQVFAYYRYQYNSSNQLVYDEYCKPDGSQYDTGSASAHSYEYDSSGKLAAVYPIDKNGNKDWYEAKGYEYDGDKMIRENVYVRENEIRETITYEYDAQGKMISAVDREGDYLLEKNTYEYDEKGLLVKVKHEEDNNASFKDLEGGYTAEYDDKGRLVRKTMPGGISSDENFSIVSHWYEYTYGVPGTDG